MKFLPLVLPMALLATSAVADVSPKVVKAETKAFARADQDDDEKTGLTGTWSSLDLSAVAAWLNQTQGLTWQIIQLTDNPFPERTIQLPEAEAP